MNSRLDELNQEILVVQADDAINDDEAEAVVQLAVGEMEAGRRKVIVDCSDLKYLSSFGLSLMLRLRNAAVAAEGEVKLAGVCPAVERVLSATKTESLFMRYSTVDEARRAYSMKASTGRTR